VAPLPSSKPLRGKNLKNPQIITSCGGKKKHSTKLGRTGAVNWRWGSVARALDYHSSLHRLWVWCQHRKGGRGKKVRVEARWYQETKPIPHTTLPLLKFKLKENWRNLAQSSHFTRNWGPGQLSDLPCVTASP
jgi:hypothetical protein